jgi:hypothetical protein
VSIGKPSTGQSCIWNLVGEDTAHYTIDLRTAKICWPQTSGMDRGSIEAVGFTTAGWGSNFTLNLALANLGFAATTSGFGTTTVGNGATLGLNGWYWTLFSWSNVSNAPISSTATWTTMPTSSRVEVQISDPDTQGAAGCTAELPAERRDLTGATFLEFDANVVMTKASSFAVQLNDISRAFCASAVNVVTGLHTYRLLLSTAMNNCQAGGGKPFDRSNVRSVDFGSPWDSTATADITITRLVIQ